MDMAVRASDEDRRRVMAALERHTTAGRLRLNEFDLRITATLDAVTLDDLAHVTQDLPEEPFQASLPNDRTGSRSLFAAFGLAMVTLIVLGLVLTIAG
jgi:DUF1707 SHOCT-like domain